MLRRLLFLLVPVLLAAAPPEPVALSPEELATLSARKVVVRADPGQGTSGGATGVLDVAAPVDRTIDAILDLEARVGEITGLKSAQVYDRTPDSLGVRWELRVLTTTVVFHVRYSIDRSSGYVAYTLDPAKTPNELVSVDGSYHVYPVAGAPNTRVVYRSTSDSGRNVPDWVKRWLAAEALSQQLEGIRTRAEAPR